MIAGLPLATSFFTSPLEGEVDRALRGREGGIRPTKYNRPAASELTPLPDPPPQGGRERVAASLRGVRNDREQSA